jgi:hypothetical protein
MATLRGFFLALPVTPLSQLTTNYIEEKIGVSSLTLHQELAAILTLTSNFGASHP